MTQALIEVRNLKQYYHQDHTVVKAVDQLMARFFTRGRL